MKKILLVIISILSFHISFSQIIIDSLKGELLIEHNFYRQVANVKPLIWSEMLSEKAKEQATLIAKNPNNYPHNLPYGMNIYKSSNISDASSIVDYWAIEQRYFDGNAESIKNKKFPRYAQIIWQQTRAVGCAIDSTKGGVYIIVCLYNPKLQINK